MNDFIPFNLFPEWGHEEAFGSPRHRDWPKIRDEVVDDHPFCACCGRKENLQVHHKLPYHLFPEMELVKKYMEVLCVGGPINCHYLAGHGGAGWHRYVENVDESIKRIQDVLAMLRDGIYKIEN